jgi:hypothetical protein
MIEHTLPDQGVLSLEMNHAMDGSLRYAEFIGRATDKDEAKHLIKVKVENNNIKFFRAGDAVYFQLKALDQRAPSCKGHVRSVEDYYFSLYVENLTSCFKGMYFRRGTLLFFNAPVLEQRIYEAMKFREQILERKADHLKQLNGINHYLWSFEQRKVKVAAEYDERLVELEKEKQKELDRLVFEKQEKLLIQHDLISRLTDFDESLKFYQIERREILMDRWNLDHDQSLPVGQRPQKMRVP